MDKVNPERNVSWDQEPSKTIAVREKWNNYVENATIHGIQYVFTSSTIWRRVLWALFLFSGIGYFSFQSSKLLKEYFSYPVNTKVSLEYETSPEFPAVTVCNFNMFRQSIIDRIRFGEDVIKHTYRHKIAGLDGIQGNGSNIDWGRFENLSMSHLYATGGHQMKDMLMDCSWIGEETCTYRNFTPVLTSMGLCHTFNSGRDGKEILKVSNAGAKFGLRLMLSIQQDDYYGLVTRRAGLKVLIHHHETPPMVDELGFAVGPGTSTFAAIRKETVQTLKSPFGSNCTDSPVTNLPGYKKYTTSVCLLSCHTRYLIEKCGCRDVKLPPVDNTKECGVSQTANCVFPENDKFKKNIGNICKCPIPCHTISFKPVVSYANFPSEKLLLELLRLNVGNASEVNRTIYRNYVSRNILELNVYFQELEVMTIKEQPAYGAESLFGEIGGQLGLCIGASLLSLLEFFDLMFSIIKIRLGFAR